MKISVLLLKGVGKAVENEAKEQKGGLTYLMINDKSLTDFTNLFFPNNFKKMVKNTWILSITQNWDLSIV